MARRSINSLSAADRRLLAQLIGEYANEAIVSMHRNMQGIHGGDPLRFLNFHRDYIGRLERWLRGRGYARFTPLPAWNPRLCVPVEFRIRISNPCPNINFLPQFSRANLRRFSSESEFGRALELRHNTVHNRLGGIMRNIHNSPSTPLFWIWHAYVDDIWAAYQEERRRGSNRSSSNARRASLRKGASKRGGVRPGKRKATPKATSKATLANAWINTSSGVNRGRFRFL